MRLLSSKWMIGSALFFILGGSSAIADVQTADGKDDAIKFCSSLYYSSEQDQCMAIVQRAGYFDSKAIPVCKSMYYTTEKLTCMENIGGKIYRDSELDFCKRKYYASEKLSCLKTSGEDYIDSPGDSLKRFVIMQAQKARRQIRSAQYIEADQTLYELIQLIQDSK